MCFCLARFPDTWIAEIRCHSCRCCFSCVLGFKNLLVYSDTHVISLVCRRMGAVKVKDSVVITMFIYGVVCTKPAIIL